MTTPDEQGHRVLGVMDELIANLAKARDDLSAVLDAVDPPAELSTERLVTADSMQPGGWVRLPGSPRWRKIAGVSACTTDPEVKCRRIDFDTYPGDRDGTFVHVDAYSTFPYQSAADFDADCDREQREVA